MRPRPALTGWTWASPKPGVTVRPRSSMTRVRGPIQPPERRVAADRDDPARQGPRARSAIVPAGSIVAIAPAAEDEVGRPIV